jgi:hypothetical protein
MSPTPDQQLMALASRQYGVVTTTDALARGFSQTDLSSRIRSGRYRSLWRGVMWVRPDGPSVPWLTRVYGALQLYGPRAIAGLGTAADLRSIAGHDTGQREVQVIVPRDLKRRRVKGIVLHRWDVPQSSITLVDRIPCTDAVRTLADLVPRLPRNQAVATLDSALNQRLVSPADLITAQQLAAGRPGAGTCGGWWSLVDGRAATPLETWARLDCTDAGLAPDELQWPVHDDAGHLLGYGDMAWLGRQRPLVGEADGSDPHSTPDAVFRDRYRANAFVSAGVDTVRMTWADVRRPGRCAAIVRAALTTEPDDLRRRSWTVVTHR